MGSGSTTMTPRRRWRWRRGTSLRHTWNKKGGSEKSEIQKADLHGKCKVDVDSRNNFAEILANKIDLWLSSLLVFYKCLLNLFKCFVLFFREYGGAGRTAWKIKEDWRDWKLFEIRTGNKLSQSILATWIFFFFRPPYS